MAGQDVADVRSYDKPPVAGKLDLSPPAGAASAASMHGGEISTEPTAEELAEDRRRDDLPPRIPSEAAASLWPADRDSPEYAHLTAIATPGSFDVTPDDIETLIAANRFKPEGQNNVIALAIRGSVLQELNELIKQDKIGLTDTRPNHVEFRCTLGFYFRGEKKITLLTGSTVPCPKYLKNYYNIVHNLPHESTTECNMMPTGCYVERVADHNSGAIKPALRTTNPDDMHDDAIVTVIRTQDDLTFGLTAGDVWTTGKPYDNVHCSYLINYSDGQQAYFSSAGCLTVRGKSDPTHQWLRFQQVLNDLGQEKRCDLMLLTGREYAIAAKLRIDGLLGDAAKVREELVRLRVGSHGDEVSRLQQKLGVTPETGYFGAETKKKLTDFQKANGIPADGIYAPALDAKLGWGVFAAVA